VSAYTLLQVAHNEGVKGAKFDSSKDRHYPFGFGLGEGLWFIKGWDEGVQGMQVGAHASAG